MIAEGFIPRSCLDYLKHGNYDNGFYWLYDDQEQLYKAYCDLSNEPGSAWTLVMSWASVTYRFLPYFSNKAFSEDAPIDENNPNWIIYRQTLSRMNSVRKHSTHWRATCDYQRTQTIEYQDYLRGKFSDLDIMTWQGSASCQPVEYVNILGKTGTRGVTVAFWQKPGNYCLHIFSLDTDCGFRTFYEPVVDFFGYYNDGLNTIFRCSLYDNSTTQWWFGGYLNKH